MTTRSQLTYKEVLASRALRLKWLYSITDPKGQCIPFRPNYVQREFFRNLHYFNVVLKARQLGMTTCIMLYVLDAALFTPNHAVGIVAHTQDAAKDLFTNKIKFAYDHLPDDLKSIIRLTSDSARRMDFSNGSSISIGTSLRSGTFQKLVITEYGKLAATYPDKALEIKTGALNTIHPGQMIFVESTAEGRSGEFFDMVMDAQNRAKDATPLGQLEPKFHFFSWFDNPEYNLSDEETVNTTITPEDEKYFTDLGVPLTANQKAWYVQKRRTQGEAMLREFPSTAEEAFAASTKGLFYKDEMALIREEGRLTDVPYDRAYPVYTAWDLGGTADYMSIWFFQVKPNGVFFIDYEEGKNMGWVDYARIINAKPYAYVKHHWPHDGNLRRVSATGVTTSRDMATAVGIQPIEIVARTAEVDADINAYCRPLLSVAWFDRNKTLTGVKRLDLYRKQWDKKAGDWLKKPVHDDASHGADAFRTAARVYKQITPTKMNEKRRDPYADNRGLPSTGPHGWLAG